MRKRWIVLPAILALFVVACDSDDPELSTDSTIVTGPTDTQALAETTTTQPGSSNGTSAPSTLVGQAVSEYTVVNEIPNDDGVAWHIVIPNGAYTDVDLENFVIELIESNPDLYGAEVFDDAEAAEVYLVPDADLTEEQIALLERHHFLTLTGRARLDFQGPFAEFTGGAIGS